MKALPTALASCALVLAGRLSVPAPPEAFEPHGFQFTVEAEVPLSPEEAFDAFTGDVRPWWDHTFYESPAEMVIEPFPGGEFREMKDETSGLIHANVTWAERGKRIVFRGPLGFHGLAADMVHTIEFAPKRDGGATVKATVNGLGQVTAAEVPIIEGVWKHFIQERFVPHVRGELDK